ncbi:MAG: branched-chain amino acid ABC transporter permease, partial [Rhodobacteraceae bacterium]|nr:branched-chain amino acid ABC transporter permease [Paracoccaceae bacterium]
MRTPLLFAFVAVLFILEGTTSAWIFSGSWNTALGILNMALISAIMALGVNLQWGYAGLFNVGIMGFVALG